MRLTATPSGEVAQMLASDTSKQGLNREPRAALLRVHRTQVELRARVMGAGPVMGASLVSAAECWARAAWREEN